MNVATHGFRDAFYFHGRSGYALVYEDAESQAAAAIPFITQKHDPGHLRLFVFESAADAEKDKKGFPASAKLAVKEVSKDEVMTFAATGYFGIPAVAFLRDQNGDDAIL